MNMNKLYTHRKTYNVVFDNHQYIDDSSTQICLDCLENAGKLFVGFKCWTKIHCSVGFWYKCYENLMHLYRICPLFLHKYGKFVSISITVKNTVAVLFMYLLMIIMTNDIGRTVNELTIIIYDQLCSKF